MKLLPNWREAWKWNSTQVFALLAALPILWEQIPPEVKALIPPEWTPYIIAAIAIAGVIVRVRDQGVAK